MYGPTPITEDNLDDTIQNPWEEHQRRQRSIRILMMVLMFLILLDGEEPPRRKNLRNRNSKHFPKLETSIWNQRRHLDILIGKYNSERKAKLIKLNNGIDEAENARTFTLDRLKEEESVLESSINEEKKNTKSITSVEDAKQLLDQVEEEERLVYHYPTNSTGFYRGTWKRESLSKTQQVLPKGSNDVNLPEDHTIHVLSRNQVLSLFPDHFIGLQFLPPGYQLAGNVTTSFNESLDHNSTEAQTTFIQSRDTTRESLKVTNDHGQLYMQLYSRPIPGMTEISLIDGIVRLVDITDGNLFSLHKDLLMRVRGVIFHSMGKLSLVGNDDQGKRRNVLVMKQSDKSSTEKRVLSDVTNEILDTHEEFYDKEIVGGPLWKKMENGQNDGIAPNIPQRRLLLSEEINAPIVQDEIDLSSIVETYPFVAESDKTKHSLGEPPAVVIRSTPEVLMKNGRSCEFVLDFNITERQWTIAEWRSMMKEIVMDLRKNVPTSDQNVETTDKKKRVKRVSSSNSNNERSYGAYTGDSRQIKDEVMVTHMYGTIHSEQCDFFSTLNVTSHRTDIEQVTAKAINYCFFMFIACLAQAVFLLRQMIYSQPQSSAVRVSIMCIGWQTVLDALLSLEHLWLCFYIQPVATAFGESVVVLILRTYAGYIYTIPHICCCFCNSHGSIFEGYDFHGH